MAIRLSLPGSQGAVMCRGTQHAACGTWQWPRACDCACWRLEALLLCYAWLIRMLAPQRPALMRGMLSAGSPSSLR